MQNWLTSAGFANVQVIEENVDFAYADEEEWLAVSWSHGYRFILEMTPPPARDQMIAEAFEHLRKLKSVDGIPQRLGALYTIGSKPSA